jgi:predicted ATP-grasp superfamily ATP-dependent carboligase
MKEGNKLSHACAECNTGTNKSQHKSSMRPSVANEDTPTHIHSQEEETTKKKRKQHQKESTIAEKAPDHKLKSEQPSPYPSFTPTFSILHEYEYGKIQLREFDTISCEGAPILAGFVASNMVSSMTAKYIVKEMDLPQIGDIVSDDFNPVAMISNGCPSHCCRLYGDERIVVFTSECEYDDASTLNQFVKAVYDFAKRHKCPLILCCDGLIDDPTKEETFAQNIQIDIVNAHNPDGDEDSDYSESDDSDSNGPAPASKEELLALLNKATEEQQNYKGRIWYITNSESLSNKMHEIGHKPVRNLIAKGVSAGIIAEMTTRGVDVVCLFAPLNKTLQIGTRASISIIHCIDEMIRWIGKSDCKHLMIDTTNLDKTAREIEKSLADAINKIDIMSGNKNAASNYMYM